MPIGVICKHIKVKSFNKIYFQQNTILIMKNKIFQENIKLSYI